MEGLYFLYFGTILSLSSGFETGTGQSEIREEGIRILYPEDFTEKAQDILKIMLDERKVIDSIAGIRLHPLKIMLVDDYAPGICINGYGLALKQQSIIDYDIYTVFPHEWVEVSLDVNYCIYEDTMNRWIGDGLANYISDEVRRVLLPQDTASTDTSTVRARNLDDYEGKVFDLRNWTVGGEDDWGGGGVGWLGYVLAPYFWRNIVQKSVNQQLIARFLAEFKMSDDKSQENAIAILSRLSGLDINKELVISGEEYREYVRNQGVYIVPRGMSVTGIRGTITIGDTSNEATSPGRKVTLDNFIIERHEVDNAKFAEFLNTVGMHEDGRMLWFDEDNNTEINLIEGKYQVEPGYENFPVRWVTWYGAKAYAKWAGMRLPTEAEWELTASNYGTTPYPWDDRKWHKCYCNWGDGGRHDDYEFTSPVDSFPMTKNHDRCLNMVGNVSEWVADWYAPYNPADTINPKGPADGILKVYRGGSYADGKEWQTSRARRGADPAVASPHIGFRCAMDIPKPEK